jgi:hypothetical protein
VTAIDDIGVVSRSLSIDGVVIPLDSDGRATVLADTVGARSIVATATDPSGKEAFLIEYRFVAGFRRAWGLGANHGGNDVCFAGRNQLLNGRFNVLRAHILNPPGHDDDAAPIPGARRWSSQ